MKVESSDPGSAAPSYLVQYPSRRRDVVVLGLAAAVGVVAIVVASGDIRNALYVFVFVVLLGLFGAARAGIRCDAGGVGRSTGLYVVQRFSWSEVERFEARDDQGIGVRLNGNGGWIRLVRQKVFGSRQPQVIAELEQQRKVHQAGHL